MTTPGYVDHRRAEQAIDELAIDRELACRANGCPLRWSAALGGMLLCSWHAPARPHEWPAITERLRIRQTQLAIERGAEPAPPPRGPLARHAGRPSREILEEMHARRSSIVAGAAGTSYSRILEGWVALRERERTGKRLTPYQAAAWRAGLRLPEGADAWAPAWFEREKEPRS
jgi:hypothetical protein